MFGRPWPMVVFAAVFTTTACGNRAVVNYDYRIPVPVPDGISTASVEEVGGDRAQTERMIGQFLAGSRGDQHSLLIMKDGLLVVEEYFEGWASTDLHPVASVSKSVTSLLIGHAIAEGGIASVHDPISEYLPGYERFLVDGKEQLTIEHLLTMSSGLDWNEGDLHYTDPNNARFQESNSDDSIEFVLGRALVDAPGERWVYNGGGVTVLGEIALNAMQTNADDLIAEAFDGLLTADEIRPWYDQADGRLNTAGGFDMTPRGMIKMGQAVLDGGVWEGRRIFDEDWIRTSTTKHIESPIGSGYGYLWFTGEAEVGGRVFSVIFARGFGGQYIHLVPALRMVVVVTAGQTETPMLMRELLEEELLPVFVR